MNFTTTSYKHSSYSQWKKKLVKIAEQSTLYTFYFVHLPYVLYAFIYFLERRSHRILYLTSQQDMPRLAVLEHIPSTVFFREKHWRPPTNSIVWTAKEKYLSQVCHRNVFFEVSIDLSGGVIISVGL